jgi:hypothetical protein
VRRLEEGDSERRQGEDTISGDKERRRREETRRGDYG